MLRKIMAFAVLISAASYLEAKTGSIGSVVARGEIRLDGYALKGSGTVFEGTVVETGSEAQSGADLLLDNGTRITLHRNSHGTLFRDHFVLNRGEVEMSAPAPYRVEVDALVVRATGPNSSARIAIGGGPAIGVFTKEGQVEVAGPQGTTLALVGPHNSETFIRDAPDHWNRQPPDHDKDGGKNGKGEDGDHHHPHPSR